MVRSTVWCHRCLHGSLLHMCSCAPHPAVLSCSPPPLPPASARLCLRWHACTVACSDFRVNSDWSGLVWPQTAGPAGVAGPYPPGNATIVLDLEGKGGK